jgi:hypothetical protein
MTWYNAYLCANDCLFHLLQLLVLLLHHLLLQLQQTPVVQLSCGLSLLCCTALLAACNKRLPAAAAAAAAAATRFESLSQQEVYNNEPTTTAQRRKALLTSSRLCYAKSEGQRKCPTYRVAADPPVAVLLAALDGLLYLLPPVLQRMQQVSPPESFLLASAKCTRSSSTCRI